MCKLISVFLVLLAFWANSAIYAIHPNGHSTLEQIADCAENARCINSALMRKLQDHSRPEHRRRIEALRQEMREHCPPYGASCQASYLVRAIEMALGPQQQHGGHWDICVGINSYGKWAQGGGCNYYGCWYPGGGCNYYGCWSAGGKCTYYGCIKKANTTTQACVDRR